MAKYPEPAELTPYVYHPTGDTWRILTTPVVAVGIGQHSALTLQILLTIIRDYTH